ncbi:NAD(P)/FAD-dependent oxidoreductase [Burkholderia cepacia]|uniref:NAD(P)/FAD-dependent oxidoreductase n=1 Tax=Burkholderia cepacia TaxID=292 RepID=UPI0029900FBB|nr:FAD-binding oxidoreductase [Burkholderia cepacia]MDW9249519.1 FAD dependent oxidoreductase family protein [Burkholderia cepacia]
MKHAHSAWECTAIKPRHWPRLVGDIDADVAIIGTGFTGLSTAHHLLKRGGTCVLLDANDPGWGASGRNGGMAVLRYKQAFSRLARVYGDAQTLQLWSFIHEAFDSLEATVSECGIKCDFGRYGHITAAGSTESISVLENDCDWLARVAGDTVPRMLAYSEMVALTGTEAYPGGYFDQRAGSIHPLNFSRGLAESVSQRGGTIFSNTLAVRIVPDGARVVVHTPDGRIAARKVVVATNAYTELAELGVDLARRVVPVASSAISTEPLDDASAEQILPQGHVLTDTRRLTNYFRLLPDRRLLYGGRGDLLGRDAPESYRGLEDSLVATFPHLADKRIDYRWSGKVAVTLDDFPHIGIVGKNIYYAMGYGGRGVALTQLLGKRLAEMVCGERVELGPISDGKFAPIPFHFMRVPAMRAVAAYYAFRDKWSGV